LPELNRPQFPRTRRHRADGVALLPGGGGLGNRGSPTNENAPSRRRLRPASRLTAAEAAADRRAINLGRSVLGASGTLRAPSGTVKPARSELSAFCELFFSHSVPLRSSVCALDLRGDTRKAEPGVRPGLGRKIRRAGNAFVHRPDRLSASAYSCSGGFVLPAPRARRRRNLRKGTCPIKGLRSGTSCNLRLSRSTSPRAARRAPAGGRD
jgi:hypothetical protein